MIREDGSQVLFQQVELIRVGPFFDLEKKLLHPGRLTAGTYSHHPFRKENDLPNLQGIMFHVNLQECRSRVIEARSYDIPSGSQKVENMHIQKGPTVDG